MKLSMRWLALALAAVAVLDLACGQAHAFGRRRGGCGGGVARCGGGTACGPAWGGGCGTWASGPGRSGTFVSGPSFGPSFGPGMAWTPQPAFVPGGPSFVPGPSPVPGPSSRPGIDDGPGAPEPARALPPVAGERVYRMTATGALHQVGWMRDGRFVPLAGAPAAPGSPEPRD